jgi:hypothetical protein
MTINPRMKKQIEDKSFNLSFHNVFNYNPINLLDIGYNKAISIFKRRIGETKLTNQQIYIMYLQLYKKISFAEKKIKSELQIIVEEAIKELYNIPDGIYLNASIIEQDEIEYDFETQNQNSKSINSINPERISLIQQEINKRIILNSIVNGSSVMIWSNVYYLVKEKIQSLNPELFELYDKYTAVVGLILYLQEPTFDLDTIQRNGICEVKFEEGLKSMGVNLPVLLLETNKVVFDYLICHSIPKDFSEDELKFYYAASDNYEHEIWHNTLSPILYEKFIQAIDKLPYEIPNVIFKLCHLSYDKLEEVFIILQEDIEEAKKLLKTYKII